MSSNLSDSKLRFAGPNRPHHPASNILFEYPYLTMPQPGSRPPGRPSGRRSTR